MDASTERWYNEILQYWRAPIEYLAGLLEIATYVFAGLGVKYCYETSHRFRIVFRTLWFGFVVCILIATLAVPIYAGLLFTYEGNPVAALLIVAAFLPLYALFGGAVFKKVSARNQTKNRLA